jgi:DNA topoisomerase IB
LQLAARSTPTTKDTNGAIAAALDPVAAAKLAKLRHVSDEISGITRHKVRHGFDYRIPGGELVRDVDTSNASRRW